MGPAITSAAIRNSGDWRDQWSLMRHSGDRPKSDTLCRKEAMQSRATIARVIQYQKGHRMGYSGFRVIKEGLFGQSGWKPVWRDPEPKAEYDAIIIGGGGHGLSTAFYLAKEHGMTNIAVLEKGYIGGGNVGRNTTIVRANYFLPGNSEFYSHSLKMWETMEQELNYNVMHS